MDKISSKDNSLIKEAASLKEKKYRDRTGEYLIEGPNLVKELMQYGGRPRFIFLRAGAGDEERSIAESASMPTAVYELGGDAFMKIASEESPQGIIAVAKKKEYSCDVFFKLADGKNILILDRLQDPGNAGTLIRSAEALGFGGVIFIKGSADPWQPKLVRAAAGSLLRLPVMVVADAEHCVEELRARHYKIYSAVMRGNVELQNADLADHCGIVIGNEGNGVGKYFLDASEKLFIPMDGNTESLNAAIAGTIIMYESKRQRNK